MTGNPAYPLEIQSPGNGADKLKKMICPYNRKSEKTVYTYGENTGAEGERNGSSGTVTTFSMMECPKEGCAVWVNGRCTYAAVSLENN